MPSTARAAAFGLAGALLGSAPALAQETAGQQGLPDKDLVVVSWGGSYTRSQMLAYVNPYRRKTGEWVAMETYNGGLDELREQVASANIVWDVIDFELADLIQACREGLLEEIDHSTLPPGADGTPAEEDFIPGAFTDCGVGQTVWATVVAYDDERVGDPPPSELADFFDVETYPGKRGLRRDPRVIMEWALMADGVPPGEVYPTLETEAGQERAFAVLNRIKNHIVWWEDGSEPAGLLDSDAVVMTSVWNGRMFRPIVENDQPFTIIWDGQIWDIDSWGITKGSYALDEAIDFVRFATSSEQLAEQAKYISYGPARESSLPMIDDEIKALLPTAEENMANALQTDAVWWADHYDEMVETFEAWLASGDRGLAGTAR